MDIIGISGLVVSIDEAKRLACDIPQRLAEIREEINRAASATDQPPPPATPPRHTAASDCDASLPSTVTMR